VIGHPHGLFDRQRVIEIQSDDIGARRDRELADAYLAGVAKDQATGGPTRRNHRQSKLRLLDRVKG
jgi:hypothetical protein